MKKIVTVLLGVLCWSSLLIAQDNLQQVEAIINSQYINASHKAFMYQVEPQLKEADQKLLEMARFKENLSVGGLFKAKNINTDTTWTYTQRLASGDSVYRQHSYNYYFLTEVGNGQVSTNRLAYNWNSNDSSWTPETKSYSWVTDNRQDSTVAYYYSFGVSEPYFGIKYIYPVEAENGADFQQNQESYTAADGWVKDRKLLSYRNELGWDTLRQDYSFNKELSDYYLSFESKNIENEDYSMNYYKYFNISGEVTNWDYEYSKNNEDGSLRYIVEKRYDRQTQRLVGTDSLHVTYQNGYAEGRAYTFEDSVWVPYRVYRSYQRTINTPELANTTAEKVTLVDSVIVYTFLADTLDNNGELIIDKPEVKSIQYYDDYANLEEVQSFSLIGGELFQIGRAEYKYTRINNYWQRTSQKSYSRNFSDGELYLRLDSKTLYKNGVYEGSENYYLNAAGDTTNANGVKQLKLEDGTNIYAYLKWDTINKELILDYYLAYYAYRANENYSISQNGYYNPNSKSGDRSFTLNGSYPGVFNDGPVEINMGDTLSFYVSAVNIDFTVPEVEVTNMPSSATYNPETRKFFWIVDEENPSPMTYTALSAKGNTSVEVLFITNNIGVNTEDEIGINGFQLSQNYPNPFNPTTNINFEIPSASEVSLKVFNMLGQEVAVLVNGRMSSGLQTVQFDASSLASGMYIYRLQAQGINITKKMMLIK